MTPTIAPEANIALEAAPLVLVDEGAELLVPDEDDEVVALEDKLEDAGLNGMAGQVRLKRGDVLNCVPTMPKLGLGVVGKESRRVYHHTLILPKMLHPTSSQYV